jgi:hypothetical protein
MVTEVRQRVTRTLLGRRGTVRDPIWVNRRVLRIGARHQIRGGPTHFLVETVPAEPSAPGTLTGAMRVAPGRRRRPGTARPRWMRWKPLGAAGHRWRSSPGASATDVGAVSASGCCGSADARHASPASTAWRGECCPNLQTDPTAEASGSGLLQLGSSNRTFKTDAGTTPADHIEAVRVEAACRLLETTRSSIEQIAPTCGFGTTPGQHRRHFGGSD